MPLSKRERNLMLMVVGTLFVVLNLFGVTYLTRRQRELQTRLTTLHNERLDAKGWLAQKEMWAQRKEWLHKMQPKMQSMGEANAALLENLQASAGKNTIKIVEQAFGDPNPQPNYQEITVKLKVAGSLESITRWLVEVQQPANFQAVLDLSMKTDSDPSKIICDLTVARWYAPNP